MKKAIEVNAHKGYVNGVEAIVIDYTVDGKSWVNHGIYINEAIEKVERIKKGLLSFGVINSRANQVFGGI